MPLLAGPGVVHIVDDDEALRDSLLELMGSAGLEARSYGSGQEILEKLDASATGCVVTDIQMPSMSGLELLRHLRARPNRMPVIVLTGHADMATAIAALKAGAEDFVEKPIETATLLQAIHSALNVASQQAELPRAGALAVDLSLLSGREREVLQGIVDGHPNKVIAHNLGISPRTVEVYRANIMTKMQASTLSDLLRKIFVGSFES